MRSLNMKTVLALSLLLAFLTACGPNIIRGRPPFVSIASLNLTSQQMTVVFSVSNQNGEPMDIQGVEIRLKIEDSELTRYNDTFKLSVGANSSEDVTVDQKADEFSRELLASLEKGQLISLPFDLEGRVTTVADGVLKFKNKGHLYPVPGRPGQFRSATTHSNRIDGEDPFKKIDSRQ